MIKRDTIYNFIERNDKLFLLFVALITITYYLLGLSNIDYYLVSIFFLLDLLVLAEIFWHEKEEFENTPSLGMFKTILIILFIYLVISFVSNSNIVNAFSSLILVFAAIIIPIGVSLIGSSFLKSVQYKANWIRFIVFLVCIGLSTSKWWLPESEYKPFLVVGLTLTGLLLLMKIPTKQEFKRIKKFYFDQK